MSPAKHPPRPHAESHSDQRDEKEPRIGREAVPLLDHPPEMGQSDEAEERARRHDIDPHALPSRAARDSASATASGLWSRLTQCWRLPVHLHEDKRSGPPEDSEKEARDLRHRRVFVAGRYGFLRVRWSKGCTAIRGRSGLGALGRFSAREGADGASGADAAPAAEARGWHRATAPGRYPDLRWILALGCGGGFARSRPLRAGGTDGTARRAATAR